MLTKTEVSGNLGRLIHISVPFEDIDAKIDKQLKKISLTAKIDGFRPGKVPYSIVKQKFNAQATYETLNQVIHDRFFEVIKQEPYTAAEYPEFIIDEAYEAGKPFVFKAKFEIFPEISLLPNNELIIEKATTVITEEDIDKTLEGMRQQKITWHTISDQTVQAKEGDKVWINFLGTIDGLPFKGGTGENMSLILGSNKTIPGFESGIIGAVTGQTLQVHVTFPEDYSAKDLAGKNACFDIHVNRIEQSELPVLDDDFAQKIGINLEEGGMAKLRENIQEILQAQALRAIKLKTKQEIMDKLLIAYQSLEVPNALVKKEAEDLAKKMQQQLLTYERLYKVDSKIPEVSPDMFTARAKEKVIVGLVLKAMLEKINIQPTPEEIRATIEEIAEDFEQPERVLEHYYKDKDSLQKAVNLTIENQLMEKILSEATIVEVPTKASDLLKEYAK